MSHLTVTIGRRNYEIACGDGEEDRLRNLASYLDHRGHELSAGQGHVAEPLLLVMIGLLVADELADARAEIDRLRQALAVVPDRAGADEAMADTIDRLAARVEALADRLE